MIIERMISSSIGNSRRVLGKLVFEPGVFSEGAQQEQGMEQDALYEKKGDLHPVRCEVAGILIGAIGIHRPLHRSSDNHLTQFEGGCKLAIKGTDKLTCQYL